MGNFSKFVVASILVHVFLAAGVFIASKYGVVNLQSLKDFYFSKEVSTINEEAKELCQKSPLECEKEMEKKLKSHLSQTPSPVKEVKKNKVSQKHPKAAKENKNSKPRPVVKKEEDPPQELNKVAQILENKDLESEGDALKEDIPDISQKLQEVEAIQEAEVIQEDPVVLENLKDPSLEKEDSTALISQNQEESLPAPEENLDLIKEKSGDSLEETTLGISKKNIPKVEVLEEERPLSPYETYNPSKNLKEEKPPQKIKNYVRLKPLKGNNPVAYPFKSLKNKEEGSVHLLYFVDQDGLVDKIQLLRSSGHSSLDNEALRTMSRHRYLPGQKGWYKHRIDFKLGKI